MTEPADYRVPAGRTGVMLNANAGRVRRSTARAIARACPDATIFWTRSMEEAEDAVEAAIESNIDTLFAGGGDGTIIDLCNRLLLYENSPQLGILKLGTGNALATWVAARPIPLDLAAWHDGEAYRPRELRFVRAEDESFPFAGMGWDAAILNDYKWVKQHLKGTCRRTSRPRSGARSPASPCSGRPPGCTSRCSRAKPGGSTSWGSGSDGSTALARCCTRAPRT